MLSVFELNARVVGAAGGGLIARSIPTRLAFKYRWQRNLIGYTYMCNLIYEMLQHNKLILTIFVANNLRLPKVCPGRPHARR